MPRRTPTPETAPRDGTARLFQHGGSQAVRLPKAFRLPGTAVRVRRLGQAVLLEPLAFDYNAWWAEIDRLAAGEFLPEGRPAQPPPPPDRTRRWR